MESDRSRGQCLPLACGGEALAILPVSPHPRWLQTAQALESEAVKSARVPRPAPTSSPATLATAPACPDAFL